MEPRALVAGWNVGQPVGRLERKFLEDLEIAHRSEIVDSAEAVTTEPRPSLRPRGIVCFQDAAPGVLDLVVLAGVDGPEQRGHGGGHQPEAQWDQDEDGRTHAVAPAAVPGEVAGEGADAAGADGMDRVNRAAFKTTPSELVDIPIAATQGGIHPNAASGTAAML